jgi:hydroxymethylglutaryl-CoA lyase
MYSSGSSKTVHSHAALARWNVSSIKFPSLEFGAHFHSTKETAQEKMKAAYESNCFRFDSALGGIGGCPMAQNDLVE